MPGEPDSAPSADSREAAPPEGEPRAKKFRFPTAFTVLAIVLLLVFVASFFVPAGTYRTDADGAPKPGTYEELPDCAAPESTHISHNDSPAESGQSPSD